MRTARPKRPAGGAPRRAATTRRDEPTSLGACFDCVPADDVLLPLLRRLPLDALLRCSALSRGWHALLAAPSSRQLFTHLSFADTSASVDDVGLVALARRAGGALRCLDVTACHLVTGRGIVAALQAAKRGAAALECLATCVWRGSDVGAGPVFTAAQAKALRAACPQLDAGLSWVEPHPAHRTTTPPANATDERLGKVVEMLRALDTPVGLLNATASATQAALLTAVLPASAVANAAFLRRGGSADVIDAALLPWKGDTRWRMSTDGLQTQDVGQSAMQMLCISLLTPNAHTLARVWAASPALQCLELAHCSLGDSGAGVLAAKLATDTQLLHLMLLGNGISGAGAASLAAALTTNAGAVLRRLDLSRNAIGDAGLNALADALAHNTSLHRLLVSRSRNSIRGLAALERAVATRPQPLQLVFMLSLVVLSQARPTPCL